ncbi:MULTISPECIES: hypothetical protein [Peptoniphilus]|jgi:hypothetical protein|uniref:hypothetical protein n=1 Tax=Peptoniphilus TaxID=162289 RepID=UPI0008DB0957|nr:MULTISPECIES: hypothetical protein [Peptoniphilus]MBS6611041.1 hypothetical protein [Peptoniphilus harei]MDU1044109.1 hypothetical protein [Peptoniphilus rhinitidis]MDU1955323.1 hypothetical protein [Peptoniphilus lacydonensis]MDU5275569.1 hypothetical protein [Peptoniphilus lacydonensis]MDU5377563.1 hypothetical protein [Peptoniphilus lacydonensis]
MEKDYLKFLVSELIFVKEDTITNLIPQTEEKYREIFGELENFVDVLNLNIRKIRRNIKLLDKFPPEDARKKADEEFKNDFKKFSEEVFENENFYIDEEKRREVEDIFREVIFHYSPKLYDFPKEDFDRAKILFKECDKDGLLNFLERKRPKELDVSVEVLQLMRDDLEIEISNLFERFPLNQLDMLEDKDAINFNLKRLKNVYEEYQEIYAGLREELNIKIAEKYSTP